jgi:membrane fusion protein, heavy metal efflux system
MTSRLRLPDLLVPAMAMAYACGDAAPAPADRDSPPGELLTIWTDALELFVEHPPLVAGEESEPWAVHLTLLASHQPVEEGVLTLRFTAPDGAEIVVPAGGPQSPGHFAPTVRLPAAGVHDLVMELEGRDLSEEIFVGPVFVYATRGEVPTEAPEPETGIVLTKEQQWATTFATALAVTRPVAMTVTAPGELVAPDGRTAVLAAPLDGLLPAEANRTMPSVGMRVARGEPLVRLSSVEGEDSWTLLRARAERLEREVVRAERLHAVEAIATRRLEEARHDLEVVRAQLLALGGDDAGERLTVRAPFAGVVAARHAVIGSRVTAGAPLLTLVDPSVLWARFRLPVEAAVRLDPVATAAVFTVEGDSATWRTTRRLSIGPVVEEGHRTIPAVYEVPNPEGRLRPGLLISGYLALGRAEEGVAVPTAAVQDEDGTSVVYVQVSGELFQRRIVRPGRSDGTWTLVTSGVAAGERVVIAGAYQVRLASLNPAAVSDHGHPH